MNCVACVLGCIWICLASAAHAGVEVDPDPRAPQVVIDVDSARPGGSGGHQSGGGSTAPPTTPPIISCPVDPVTGIYGCRDVVPEPDVDRPEPTEADVLRATRTIGLPSLKVNVQPADKTLVNVLTVLYTEPQPFERSVTLLSYDVDISAKPVSYLWVHGDGTDQQTTSPGGRYPSMDVTHRYQHPKKNARVQVNVTYQVRYRIDGRAWETIGQHLTASGPAVQLDVVEAAPVLTKP